MVTMPPPPETGGRPASMIQIRVGDKTYPYRSAPMCRTCQSPERLDIEHKILSGYSFASIAAWAAAQHEMALESGEAGALPPPTADNLRAHTRGHLPPSATTWRKLIEQRADEVGDDLAAGAELLADHVSANRLIVQLGMEKLADGSLTPSLGDVHAASKFLAVHDAPEDSGATADQWRDALLVHLEVAKQFIPQASWPQFAAALNSHPTLRALASGSARDHDEDHR